jgi:hypothetical protein
MIFVGDTPMGWKNRFHIVDDDFEETVETEAFFSDAIIDVYERRGLRVGSNLYRALEFYLEKFVPWRKEKITQKDIDDFKQSNGKLAKYEEDLQKYLVLL